jgi:hypothetical protein
MAIELIGKLMCNQDVFQHNRALATHECYEAGERPFALPKLLPYILIGPQLNNFHEFHQARILLSRRLIFRLPTSPFLVSSPAQCDCVPLFLVLGVKNHRYFQLTLIRHLYFQCSFFLTILERMILAAKPYWM